MAAELGRTVLIIGAFDTKGEEYEFVRNLILARGHKVLSVDIGVMGDSERFEVDISSSQIAESGGASLEALRLRADRGHAMHIMSVGATVEVENDSGEIIPERKKVKPGVLIHVPPGVYHETINTGWEPLKCLAVYAPPGPEEILRSLPDCRIVPPKVAS